MEGYWKMTAYQELITLQLSNLPVKVYIKRLPNPTNEVDLK
jgi:hypothetical protein